MEVNQMPIKWFFAIKKDLSQNTLHTIASRLRLIDISSVFCGGTIYQRKKAMAAFQESMFLYDNHLRKMNSYRQVGEGLARNVEETESQAIRYLPKSNKFVAGGRSHR